MNFSCYVCIWSGAVTLLEISFLSETGHLSLLWQKHRRNMAINTVLLAGQKNKTSSRNFTLFMKLRNN